MAVLAPPSLNVFRRGRRGGAAYDIDIAIDLSVWRPRPPYNRRSRSIPDRAAIWVAARAVLAQFLSDRDQPGLLVVVISFVRVVRFGAIVARLGIVIIRVPVAPRLPRAIRKPFWLHVWFLCKLVPKLVTKRGFPPYASFWGEISSISYITEHWVRSARLRREHRARKFRFR